MLCHDNIFFWLYELHVRCLSVMEIGWDGEVVQTIYLEIRRWFSYDAISQTTMLGHLTRL